MAEVPRRPAYFDRLSAKTKAIYRRGDAITPVQLRLPDL